MAHTAHGEALLKPSGHYMYRQFNIQQFYVLPTQLYLCVFCVDLRTNSDYFPIQHKLTGFYNRDSLFTARYGLDIYIQISLTVILKS